MPDLIDIETLVNRAKEKGMDFGKGDPYNRLRYYTKIGWLPHMERKKEENTDSVRGHYPEWAVKRLIQIENYKKKGLDNDAINKKIVMLDKMQNVQNLLLSNEIRTKIIIYVSFFMLLLIIGNETDIIHLGKSKTDLQSSAIVNDQIQILDSGTAFVPANSDKVHINSRFVEVNSKIYVTFNNDYSPATKYWVSDKIPQSGFELNLDSPVLNNSEFSWWISN